MFVGLLRLDYTALYTCSVKGCAEEGIVVCDGVSVSFQASRLKHDLLRKPTSVSVERTPRQREFAKERRIYIDKEHLLREQLQRFAEQSMGPEELTTLLNALEIRQFRVLAGLVKQICRWERPLRRRAPGMFNLLVSLARTSPMSSYVPYPVAKAIQDRSWDEALRDILYRAPIFFNAVHGTHPSNFYCVACCESCS
jgi:hypothetical protein